MINGPLNGLRAWLWQRLSAIYLLFFILWLLAVSVFFPPENAAAWRGLVLDHPNRVAWGLFFLLLILHAWIGIRDVILDYVKPLTLRLVVFALFIGGLLACVIWAWLVLSGGRS